MTLTNRILKIWHQFDAFPMETLTKAWLLRNSENPKQRSIEQMQSHRQRFGASGNCFDLAIWLLNRFRSAGLHAYFIGSNLGNQKAHVAVVAIGDRGQRYLCDLGDPHGCGNIPATTFLPVFDTFEITRKPLLNFLSPHGSGHHGL
jgi:hypothetical protein